MCHAPIDSIGPRSYTSRVGTGSGTVDDCGRDDDAGEDDEEEGASPTLPSALLLLLLLFLFPLPPLPLPLLSPPPPLPLPLFVCLGRCPCLCFGVWKGAWFFTSTTTSDPLVNFSMPSGVAPTKPQGPIIIVGMGDNDRE